MYYDLWTYREEVYPDQVDKQPDAASKAMRDDMNLRGDSNGDMVGFSVEALDGSIGKIDEATHEAGASYVVVDTGPWIFGKKVMLPAGVIARVDSDREVVSVNRTKDEIKNAPEFDDSNYRDSTYRDEIGSYYGPEGAGYRDW
jgi:hypothetical protein